MSYPHRRPRLRALLVVFLVSLATVGTPLAAAATDAPAPTLDDTLDDDTTDDTTNTTDSTDDTVEETTDTVDETTNTTDSTTDTTEEALNETTASPTEDTVNETTETTEEALNETTDSTAETLNETAETTEETVEQTTEATLNGTTETVEETPDTDETLPETTEARDAGSETTDSDSEPAVDVTTETATAPAGNSEEGGSDTVPVAAGVAGVVVAGAAGATVLSSGGTVTSPSVVQSLSASAKTAATGTRAWVASLGDEFWRMASLFRYSRWDGSDPLEHDGRAAIFDTIEDSPGIYLSALDGSTDHSLSTLRHHLRILEAEGLISTEKVRGKRRYFPVSRAAVDPALVAALDDPATEAILLELADSGPSSGGDLADALDRDPSTVSHHLSRLEAEDLVVRERDGRSVLNRLSDHVEMALSDDALVDGEDAAAADD